MTFYSAEVPRVSQEFYDSIKAKVPELVVEPGQRIEDMMYVAGMHKVLEYIARAIGPSKTPNREI